jgi:hypothetical protein
MVNVIEKRQGQPAIPHNPAIYLTWQQERALRNLARRGWKLLFIRRSLFREAMPVLMNTDRRSFSVLGSDGRINSHCSFALRS